MLCILNGTAATILLLVSIWTCHGSKDNDSTKKKNEFPQNLDNNACKKQNQDATSLEKMAQTYAGTSLEELCKTMESFEVIAYLDDLQEKEVGDVVNPLFRGGSDSTACTESNPTLNDFNNSDYDGTQQYCSQYDPQQYYSQHDLQQYYLPFNVYGQQESSDLNCNEYLSSALGAEEVFEPILSQNQQNLFEEYEQTCHYQKSKYYSFHCSYKDSKPKENGLEEKETENKKSDVIGKGLIRIFQYKYLSQVTIWFLDEDTVTNMMEIALKCTHGRDVFRKCFTGFLSQKMFQTLTEKRRICQHAQQLSKFCCYTIPEQKNMRRMVNSRLMGETFWNDAAEDLRLKFKEFYAWRDGKMRQVLGGSIRSKRLSFEYFHYRRKALIFHPDNSMCITLEPRKYKDPQFLRLIKMKQILVYDESLEDWVENKDFNIGLIFKEVYLSFFSNKRYFILSDFGFTEDAAWLKYRSTGSLSTESFFFMYPEALKSRKHLCEKVGKVFRSTYSGKVQELTPAMFGEKATCFQILTPENFNQIFGEARQAHI